MKQPPFHAIPLIAAALVALAAGTGLVSCTDSAARPAAGQQVIPAGRGNFVQVEDEMVLDDLVGKRVELIYGRPKAVGADGGIVSWRVACTPTPLDPPERCGMTVVAVLLVHADGRTQEVPASGKVMDNSDGQPGFRVELSRTDHARLAIPAGASATVVFSAPVALPGF